MRKSLLRSLNDVTRSILLSRDDYGNGAATEATAEHERQAHRKYIIYAPFRLSFFFLLLEWNEKRGARSKEWDGWGSETEKLKIERKIFRRGTDKKASNEKIDYEKEEGTIAGVAGKENSHWEVD